MSETKHYKGKLIEILPTKNKSLKEISLDFLDKAEIIISPYEYEYHKGDYLKILCDEFSNKFLIYDNRLFEIIAKEIDVNDEILNVSYNGKSYNFECRFYNGATCLSEMLENGLDNLTKIKK